MTINSSDSMIKAIRLYGIIPFLKGSIPGVSIEELTPKECWFITSDVLGPWDWKIDAVREGDIAYGKFINGKSTFATKDWYRHIMNVRRNDPKYEPKDIQKDVLDCIRERGSVTTRDLRKEFSMKKTAMESVIAKLQMGSWTVIGDFERCYRGPNLEYVGWQIASNTTPEALFGFDDKGSSPKKVSGPSWAKHLMEADIEQNESPLISPEDSLKKIREHLESLKTLL